MLYRLLLLASLVGCAQGAHEIVHIVDSDRGGDDDASDIDAPERQHPDASQHVDAGNGCTVTQLLKNGAFDDTPLGTGWTENPIQSQFPIITTSTFLVPPQSGTAIAWMGDFVSGNDSMYEAFTVPANTTSLVLSGYYAVGTDEISSIAFDTATVAFTQTGGTVLETVLNLDNTSATANWTVINYTVNQDLSGQTVRLHFASSNDSSNVTDFYFDTLALNATHCP
jgi:hypothetical protein